MQVIRSQRDIDADVAAGKAVIPLYEDVNQNSLTRQRHWLHELNMHVDTCENCRHAKGDCKIWEDLVSAYNEAREV